MPRRELIATATSVNQAQQLQVLYQEDEAQLLLYLNAMKAALQDALKEKEKVSGYHEDTREDWSKKLKARHKEVEPSFLVDHFDTLFMSTLAMRSLHGTTTSPDTVIMQVYSSIH